MDLDRTENKAALEAWVRETGIRLVQVNGQRKYGGPPPGKVFPAVCLVGLRYLMLPILEPFGESYGINQVASYFPCHLLGICFLKATNSITI